MRSVRCALCRVSAAFALLAVPVTGAAPQVVPEVTEPCSRAEGAEGAEGATEWYADVFRTILTDPEQRELRAQWSLKKLEPSEPIGAWLAPRSDCLDLVQRAVAMLNAEYDLTKSPARASYVTVAAGPYILYVPQDVLGEVKDVVVFYADDRSALRIILVFG